VPLKNAVISAMHADFEKKDRRARNIVVSGLLTSQSDKTSVEKLCNTEFCFVPQIIKCSRLGRPEGRIQPLRVVLRSVEEADYLIKNAKRLRQSNDLDVRNSAYINSDLTKAEAQNAYQCHCRHRKLVVLRNSGCATQSVNHDRVAPLNSIEMTQVDNVGYLQAISVFNSRISSVKRPIIVNH